jgi:cephalosporin-C deacetylase-like acetyl esterase
MGRIPRIVEYIGYGGGAVAADWLTERFRYAHFVMETGQGAFARRHSGY